MIHEAGYDRITLYSATRGMNQNISTDVLPLDFSFYIQNIFPNSLGEAQVRYGTVTDFDAVDDPIEAFPFRLADGGEQEILYLNTYRTPNPVSNLRITSSDQIFLTSTDTSFFQPDTYLAIQYRTTNGTLPVSYYLIKEVIQNPDNINNSVLITVEYNSFPFNLQNFYITQQNTTITYVANNSIRITVPNDFVYSLFYSDAQKVKLVVNATTHDLTIATNGIDHGTQGQLTFTFDETTVPNFTGTDTVSFSYASLTPEAISISYSVGTIKVRDKITNQFLTGPNQTLTGLSVACLPRGEFFGGKYWIYNGVNRLMTWDGSVLQVYKEYVKEQAQSFNRTDATHFSFTANAAFVIAKYQNNNSIELKINGVITETTVSNVSQNQNIVTITTADNLPTFTGQDRIELFYADYPPPFSFMKSALDRLWALGPGPVSLEYRDPNEALRVYYSYTSFSNSTVFKFFNENTKSVPSLDISAKHGGIDNLEAIININGLMAFIGRQKTQVWSGYDPVNAQAANAFTWVSTLPAGIYHGNLIVEVANDAYFANQNGFLSFSTLNIARQFSATSEEPMDRILRKHIDTINSNYDYRACRSFKYKYGGFCGFKVGQNDVIASMYHIKLYWWFLLSGSFTRATSFLSNLDEALYLYIDNKVYQYADGIKGEHIYGDYDGDAFIDFAETKIINRDTRWANKRYEVQADYSSSVIINPENYVSISIRGNLRESFVKEDVVSLPYRGDVLGTINLVQGNNLDLNYPDPTAQGFRLDSPYQNQKGRLKFISSNFWVSLMGKTKDGPINFKKIRLFGIRER